VIEMKKNKNIKIMLFFLSLMTAISSFVIFAGGSSAQSFSSGKKNPAGLKKQHQNEITLEGSVGIDNSFFEDCLTPVEIKINNGTEKNFEGEIIVEISYKSRYRILNALAGAKSSRTYTLYIKPGRYTSNIKYSLINSSNVEIYSGNVNAVKNSKYEYYILCASESASFYNEIKNQPIEQKKKSDKNAYDYTYKEGDPGRINIVSVKPGELYKNHACYESYSLVIFNDADVSVMTREQENAIMDFVNNGGNILISYGGFISKISNSPLAQMLPVKITGTEVLDGGEFYQAASMKIGKDPQVESYSGTNVAITVSEPLGNASVTIGMNKAGQKIPIIAYRNFGKGMVFFTAFDISQTDLSQIKYIRENITGLLKKSTAGDEYSTNTIASNFSAFTQIFNNFMVNPPAPEGVMFLLVLFLIFIGPIFYAMIRNRVTMARLVWIPSAASALVFLSFGVLDFDFMITKTEVFEFGFQWIDNLNSKARSFTAVSILQPPLSKCSYDVDLAVTNVYDEDKNYSDSGREVYIDDEMAQLATSRLGVNLSKYVLTRNVSMQGKFTLVSEGGDPSETADTDDPQSPSKKYASVVNNTEINLEDCYIFYNRKFFKFDKFSSGDRVDIKSAPKRDIEDVNQLIVNIMQKNVTNYSKFNTNYRTDLNNAFFNVISGIVNDSASKSPVLLGFSKGGTSFSAAAKTTGCNINNLRSIVVARLQ